MSLLVRNDIKKMRTMDWKPSLEEDHERRTKFSGPDECFRFKIRRPWSERNVRAGNPIGTAFVSNHRVQGMAV